MAALITQANVTEFVQMYFQLEKNPETVKEKCQQMYDMQGGSKLQMSDIYHIFWAIRLLADPGKYDHDDIEFHVKKNPVFAEIPTTDYEGDKPKADTKTKAEDTKPKQVGLLRHAIKEYKQILAGQLKMIHLDAKL
jgi:hypothetical protein